MVVHKSLKETFDHGDVRFSNCGQKLVAAGLAMVLVRSTWEQHMATLCYATG